MPCKWQPTQEPVFGDFEIAGFAYWLAQGKDLASKLEMQLFTKYVVISIVLLLVLSASCDVKVRCGMLVAASRLAQALGDVFDRLSSTYAC